MLVVLRMYTQLFRHLFKIEISCCKRNSTNFGKGFTGDLLETENKVTFFKKKKSKLDRVQENAEYIYGIHPILCALKYRKRKFHTVYFKNAAKNISDILEKCRSLGIQTIETSPKAMSKLLPPDRAHQGIIAEVDKMIIPEITDYIQFCELVILSDDSRWIIPWEIQDPMNLGNILRTAAFFGLNGCLLPSKKSCTVTSTVSKASSGAVEAIQILKLSNPIGLLKDLKNNGAIIIGTSKPDEGVTPLFNLKLANGPVFILFGNEGSGLPKEVKELCSLLVSIGGNPIEESIESLNVTSAASIVLYEIMKNKTN